MHYMTQVVSSFNPREDAAAQLDGSRVWFSADVEEHRLRFRFSGDRVGAERQVVSARVVGGDVEHRLEAVARRREQGQVIGKTCGTDEDIAEDTTDAGVAKLDEEPVEVDTEDARAQTAPLPCGV